MRNMFSEVSLGSKFLSFLLFMFFVLNAPNGFAMMTDEGAYGEHSRSQANSILERIAEIYPNAGAENHNKLYKLLTEKYHLLNDDDIISNFNKDILFSSVAIIAIKHNRNKGHLIYRDHPSGQDIEYVESKMTLDDVLSLLEEYNVEQDKQIYLRMRSGYGNATTRGKHFYRGGGVYEIERTRLLHLKRDLQISTVRGGSSYGNGLYLSSNLQTALSYADRHASAYELSGFKGYENNETDFMSFVLRVNLQEKTLIVDDSQRPEQFSTDVPFLPFSPTDPAIYYHEQSHDGLVETASIKDLRGIKSIEVYSSSLSYKVHIPFFEDEIIEHQLKKIRYFDTSDYQENFFCCRNARVYDERIDEAIRVNVCSYAFVGDLGRAEYFFYCYIEDKGYEVRPAFFDSRKNREDLRHFHLQYW